MANTSYVLLERITVGAAGASSVTFSGIPQTGYTDLVVKASARSNRADGSDWIRIDVNGVNASYTDRKVLGNGTTVDNATSAGTVGFPIDGNTSTASTFANSEIYIPNYTSSNYKSFSIDTVSETNGTTSYTGLVAGLWSSTSAITSLKLVPHYSTGFLQYTTFYLYGVAKLGTTPAIFPKATGGDTIMTDGTYWYHTFISSGTFTPASALTCDYLVVAGGGAGGNYYAGGGGAGGLRSTVTATGGGGSLETALSLGTSAYTVTVGAGGAAATANGAQGGSGSNSVFATITSTGGGGGGGANFRDGLNGGSGGGSEESGTTGTGTSGQGFAGGAGQTISPFRGGGGGGAGAVGATGTASGNGGAGVATSISGSSVTYAGGGGAGVAIGGTAGTGGTGGGGNGSVRNSGSPTNGTANTGSGGGANGTDGAVTSGAGGSGIVIVRYAV